jgi:hypothetical protein
MSENSSNPVDAYETSGTSPTTGAQASKSHPIFWRIRKNDPTFPRAIYVTRRPLFAKADLIIARIKTRRPVMSTQLPDFALQYRLRKPKVDDCGDLNIVGKRGDIYEHGKFFAATILRAPNGKHWAKYREAAKTLSCQIIQNGDEEGTFLFDPANETQAKLAIEATQTLNKRNLSREALEKLTQRGVRTRLLQRKPQKSLRTGGK